MDERDNNQLAIWKNDNKQSDRHPDFKGSGYVDGVEMWVSAWKRDPGANPRAPALKIKVTPKDEAHKAGVSQAKAVAEEDPNDDIPF